MNRKTIFILLVVIAFCSMGVFAQDSKVRTVTSVRDVDHPARQPFSRLVTTTNTTFEPVPEGKVLVIEFISGRASSTDIGTGGLTLLTYFNGEIEAANVFSPSYYSEHVSTNKTYFTHPAKIYIPAGRVMQLVWQGDVAPSFFVATISGHFIDLK